MYKGKIIYMEQVGIVYGIFSHITTPILLKVFSAGARR